MIAVYSLKDRTTKRQRSDLQGDRKEGTEVRLARGFSAQLPPKICSAVSHSGYALGPQKGLGSPSMLLLRTVAVNCHGKKPSVPTGMKTKAAWVHSAPEKQKWPISFPQLKATLSASMFEMGPGWISAPWE